MQELDNEKGRHTGGGDRPACEKRLVNGYQCAPRDGNVITWHAAHAHHKHARPSGKCLDVITIVCATSGSRPAARQTRHLFSHHSVNTHVGHVHASSCTSTHQPPKRRTSSFGSKRSSTLCPKGSPLRKSRLSLRPASRVRRGLSPALHPLHRLRPKQPQKYRNQDQP